MCPASAQQVLDLLDSIARNYPIGSFLLWNSDSASLASDQNVAGLAVEPAEDGDDTAYLLDGCQRLSTISGALYWTPDRDPDSYWNLVYDLEQEQFLHRADLDDPPAHQLPLRLLPEPSDFVERIADLPKPLRDSAKALYDRFARYEVAVVTLQGTSLSEIGRIFERVNTRGTPLTTVEIVRAATWTSHFDLLTEIDRVRGVLAAKHYGRIDHKLLLRAISAAAGKGFTTEGIERLALVPLTALRTAIAETEAAARRAVDFLTTETGTPTAEALPYLNQLAVVIEIFRQVPTPTSAQYAEIRGWFWSKDWLMTQGSSYEDANVLANIVMLTAISNHAFANQPPSAYLTDEMAFCDELEMGKRLESSLISPEAFDAAMSNDYERFIEARAETLLAWALDLTRGAQVAQESRTDAPEVIRHGMTVEVADNDTDD